MIFQSAALSQNVTIQNMYDNDNVEVTAAAGKMNRCKKKLDGNFMLLPGHQ